MTLEKAKKKKKITKSQLQKQKQVQNVIVNLQAPVAKKTRKRTPKPKPAEQTAPKSFFEAPVYMPTVASYNKKPTQDNNSILSDILKIIKPTKVEDNELEKAKPQEREAQQAPTLAPSLGAPQRRTSLLDEIRSDPFNTKQTFINTPPFEAPQEQFSFNAPLHPKPLPQTLAQQIRLGREKKFTTPPKQAWAEVETGGHFGLLGVNDAQIKAHKEAKKEFTHEALSMPVVTDEARPTSEAIDLGMVPRIAQEMVQEDRVETNEPVIQLQPLTMGAKKPFVGKLILPPPAPEEKEEDVEFIEGDIHRTPDKEVAQDIQEFYDYMKTLDMTAPTRDSILATPVKEESLVGQLGAPHAESRAVSSNAPEALAELLIEQAEGSKIGSKELRDAGFRNANEAYDAIMKWNRIHPDNKINKSYSKTIATMAQELSTTPMKDFKGLYAFNIGAPLQLSQLRLPQNAKPPVSLSQNAVPRKVVGARHRNANANANDIGGTEL